jgi:hypothetical protein
MLCPQTFCLKRPPYSTKPIDNKTVDPNPLGAVVAVTDDHPEIPVRGKKAAPFAAESARQLARIFCCQSPPFSTHPVWRRSKDDCH